MTRRFLLWLLVGLAPLFAQDGVKPLTILHSNDLHAHLLPDEHGNGGLARLATAVRQEEMNCAACLYLNAGDLVQGTPVSTLFHGTPVYEIANLLGFDASTLGNHEFDYGWRRVQEFGRIAHFPVLSANVVDANGKSITGQPYLIKNVGGIRVAIIGVLMGDLVGNLVSPAEVGPWKVLPVLDTVRKYAAELRDRSDLIVVLGHIHDKEEVEEILKQIPEVSVVVAGHTHVAYPKMMNVDGRVAVLVNSYADQLGRLDLQVDIAGKKLRAAEWKKIPIDAKLAPAPDVERLVNSWEAKVTGIVDVPIGESARAMTSRDPELRKTIEKAMAEQTGADIGWINTGNIRDGLPAGRLLARHIWNILPFDDYLVMGKFRGSQLPKSVTDRYPVQPDREYTVVTTDFTADNQAARDQFNTTGLKFPKKGPLQRDAVIAWVRKKKKVPVEEANRDRPIYPIGRNSIFPRHSSLDVASAMSARSATIWPIVIRSWCAYTIPQNDFPASRKRAPSTNRSTSCDTKIRPRSVARCNRGTVVQFRRAVFLRRQNIDATKAQPDCHGSRHMRVHIKRDTQRDGFSSASLRRKSGSDAWSASVQARFSRFPISASSWCWFS